MSVKVLKVKTVQDHPYADSLKVYQFYAQDVGEVQVIANLENIYDVGDLAYVALEGAHLQDGTKIIPSRIRGVVSYGMALGKCEEVKLGDDVTDKFCITNQDDKLRFCPWPDIEGLHNVLKNLSKTLISSSIKYKARVKVHGTNAGVIITQDGRVAAQKRTSIIKPQNDNAGFATWVHANEEYFKSLKYNFYNDVIIYGEWAGMQKGVAISEIGKKIFAIFAIQHNAPSGAMMEIEPDTIKQKIIGHDDIHVLPWHGDEIILNFSDYNDLQRKVNEINDIVNEVEKEDPWVKSVFGVSGTGEGLVYYPIIESDVFPLIKRFTLSEYIFKAKGEKHKVVNNKKPVQIDPEIVKSVQEFADLFVTENRLNQGVEVACDGKFEMKKMGDFLKWFGGDVKKESTAELEAANLEWRDVGKEIMTRAREWYKKKAIPKNIML